MKFWNEYFLVQFANDIVLEINNLDRFNFLKEECPNYVSYETLTNILTWNVRGIKYKEEDLIEEMERGNIGFPAVTETKKKGSGIKGIHKGYWIILDHTK